MMHESRTLPGTFGTVLEGTVLSEIAKASPWNMHSLKCILAAASWEKVKANRTATRKSWHFSESEAARVRVSRKQRRDRIEKCYLIDKYYLFPGEAGGRADRPCEMTSTVERPLASRFGLVVWGRCAASPN